MNHSITPLATTCLAVALAGCGFNPIGESTFDCNRKEHPSEYCRSFKALEKSTNGPLPESRFDKEFRMSDHDRATGIAPVAPASGAPGRVATAAAALPHQRLAMTGDPVAGMPVRKAPVVQRVYIKRFVDENDSLEDDVVVYREIKGARWSGFDGAGREPHATATYPHRAKDSTTVEGDLETPSSQPTNLAQPDSSADGRAGSAMSPAGPQSGGVNAPKVER